MADPKPTSSSIPSEDNGYQSYKAAGKLKGKRAIITGGDSGIGRAIAILFALEGASSLIVYLPEEEIDARETQRLVQERGTECHTLEVDLRKKENCQKVVDYALECLGAIDILVNNAGYQNMVPEIQDLAEYAPTHTSLVLCSGLVLLTHRVHRDQWEHTFQVNIHPYFYLAKYALPHLKNGSTIINCASVNAYIGRPDLLDYTATKGAIVSLTRALSNQLVEGIRVNAVCPGPGNISPPTFIIPVIINPRAPYLIATKQKLT